MTQLRPVVLAVTLVTALAAVPRPAAAQGFGVQAGPLWNNFKSDNVDFKSRPGFEGGVFFGSTRNHIIGFRGEINYLQKKAKGDFSPNPTVTLDYIDVPTLLRIGVGTKSLAGASIYFLVGPSFDFQVSNEVTNISAPTNFNTFDFCAIAAVGVEITLFTIEGRYQRGFKSVSANTSLSVSDVTTQSWALLFGVRFH
jgi:hypothetical protein